jgi:glycosyltransferase involved in cell wall biosynthesis
VGSQVGNGTDTALACVVLSLGNEPGVAAAVRSLWEQEPRPEIVVVNSGGGDPGPALRAAGLDVPVVNRPERLYPGAARNVGIAATRGPYVAFLAADCRATAGWVAARLHAHRAGAAAVASVIAQPPNGSRSAAGVHLLLYAGRMPDTPAAERQLYGVSYDRRLFERFGCFREELQGTEDREFNRRLEEEPAIRWSSEVVTVHAHPERPLAALQYLYGRGQRELWGRNGAGEEGRVVRDLLVQTASRVPRALRAMGRGGAGERRARRRGWPLLIPGTAAYAAGVLHASRASERPLPLVRDDAKMAR